MKIQQMKDLIEIGCIYAIQIQPIHRYINTVVYKRVYQIWVEGKLPEHEDNALETARGDVREYKTIDSAYKTIQGMLPYGMQLRVEIDHPTVIHGQASMKGESK